MTDDYTPRPPETGYPNQNINSEAGSQQMVDDRPRVGMEGERSQQQFDEEEVARQRKIQELLDARAGAAVEEERVLVRWKSPARPYKERNREYYTTIGAIVVLLSIILMFAREFLLVAVIISFAFVSYVLASVRPEETENEITTRGIRAGGKFYRWGVLGRFWFKDKFGQKMVSIETGLNFPGEILLMLGELSENKVKDILRVYLLHETPEPKFVDKAAKWLQEKVPLETT